jgi:hypothetical protein
VRIWFNEQFRGTYQLIGLLRASYDLHVLGSHREACAPFLQVCDLAFPEPVEAGDAFVDVALALCAREQVDVFVPGREMLAVARRRAEFEAQGTKVLVGEPRGIEALQDKRTTYEQAAALGVAVPAWHAVQDLAGFRAACDALEAAGLPVCVKPAVGVAGAGFYKLDDATDDPAALFALPSHAMSRARYEDLLGRAGTVAPLLVSEWLPGPEWSTDCLSDDGTLLAAVTRGKTAPPFVRTLVEVPAVRELAERVVQGFGLGYLSNVQTKERASGEPVLLEVNTRAASGLYQSCTTGVDFPGLALRLLLDGRLDAVPAPVLPAALVTYADAMPYRPLVAPGGVAGFDRSWLPPS